jgi:hypothetical protein
MKTVPQHFLKLFGYFEYIDTFPLRFLLPFITERFSADVKLDLSLSRARARTHRHTHTLTHTHTHTLTHTHYKRNRYAGVTPSWGNPEGSYSLSAGQVAQGSKGTGFVWNLLKWNATFSWMSVEINLFRIQSRKNSGISVTLHRREGHKPRLQSMYRGADKSVAWPRRKQATAIGDFDVHISYL